MPLAAYGGRDEMMNVVAPLGPVYQAGTLSGNPVAVSAGLATLERSTPALYESSSTLGAALEDGLVARDRRARRRSARAARRLDAHRVLPRRSRSAPGPTQQPSDTKAFAAWHAACSRAASTGRLPNSKRRSSAPPTAPTTSPRR